jgi:hydroxyethylthiazole kinase-like uncharacterized protein yjeF
MRPLLKSSDIRAWDQFTISDQNISSLQLMERAAIAFCKLYKDMFKNQEQITCIIAGPGNNGGDGFAIARILYEAGYKKIFIYESPESKDNDAYNDRNTNRSLLLKIPEIKWIKSEEELNVVYNSHSVNTIDALFGTGLNRDVSEEWHSVFSCINSLSNRTISVDIPSGLQSDQQTLYSQDNAIIMANHTFTFQTYKRVMTFPETGKFCGRIHVLDIGLSEKFKTDSPNTIYLLDHSVWQTLESGKTFDHKGHNGKTLHFCGSLKMPGAGILCSRAAHRSGAGYVMALVPKANVNLLMSQHSEVLPLPYNETDGFSIESFIAEISGITSILAGPGLGTTEFVRRSILQLLKMELSIPLILDADALNVLNGKPEILGPYPGPLVITPHAKEFDKLFGVSENWSEREKKMIQMAMALHICIVLKGAFTRVAFEDGTLYINTSGNPGLAKAGSGDVLSGMLSAHLARYRDFKNAVLSAVFLHGKVADDLSEGISEKSILASDLIEQLGKSIKFLESNE